MVAILTWAGWSRGEDSAGAAFRDVTVEEAAALLEKEDDLVVLDVRTPREFEAGHLKGAKMVTFGGEDFERELAKLDRKQTYLMHCASGGRGSKTLEVMKRLGFESVLHLQEGFNGWAAAGQPVEE